MRNGDEGCAEYEMREAEAHEAEMEAAAGAEGEAMAEAEEQEMTDPVQEEMMHKAEVLAAPNDPSWKPRAKLLITDLLRVIRGHIRFEGRHTVADRIFVGIWIADNALAKILESLPEEVKDD